MTAGSGITPVLSLVSTTLEAEPGCRWTVIFGNRSADQVMFLDELEGLKDRYPDRLQLVHVLSREQGVMPLFTGRIDEAKLTELLDRVVSPAAADRVVPVRAFRDGRWLPGPCWRTRGSHRT